MDTDELCEQDFEETVDENGYLHELFTKRRSCMRFLSGRKERVYMRSIQMDDASSDVWLEFDTDIDGCVVEISDLGRVRLPLRHLTICPSSVGRLFDVKGLLKKHVDLEKYSHDALCNFNNSAGLQLFFAGGWECWLALIPDPDVRQRSLGREVIRHMTMAEFLQLRNRYREALVEYIKSGIARRTLMKNDMNDMRKLFVLPDDISAILAALQSVMPSKTMQCFKPILFCFRFGEKMKGGLSLSAFPTEIVKKITAHVAVDISANLENIDLLWSTSGIQQIVGNRGTLSTCLSLADCANFQSNLDGRSMDVTANLRKVCFQPDKVKFVQLYADVAHIKPKTRFHPVSGLIAGGMCFPKPTADAFVRDSTSYLSVLEHNFALLNKSTCRLEIVAEVTKSSDLLRGPDVLDLKHVNKLLKQEGLLVPIPRKSLLCIQHIGLWLTKELKDMSVSFAKTGNVQAIWRAYQFELACEKLLWGYPLCNRSFRYAINLGPGVLGPSRSLSDAFGFLALEASTSCMESEMSIPPPKLWTASDKLCSSIQRSVGLHDHIDGSYPVIGRLLLTALLKDLYEIGRVGAHFRFEEFLAALKAKESRFELVGAVTVESLKILLSAKRRTSVHMVYSNLLKLLESHRLPVQEIIKEGLSDMGMQQFPAIDTYDVHGHAVLGWDFRKNFWKVVQPSEEPPTGLSGELYTQLVKADVESRGLIFPSKLKKLPAVWPWISPCLRKLSQEKLSQEKLISTLSFLSSVAFIMQGWFVDYDRFRALFDIQSVPQFRLKCLEIQSKLQLAKFNFENLKIFRLHESIPHRVHLQVKEDEASERPVPVPMEDSLTDDTSRDVSRLISDEDQGSDQGVVLRQVTCEVAGIVKRAWSGAQLAILHELKLLEATKSTKELYQMYRVKCIEESLPFQTFGAFRKKIGRIS